MKLKLKNKKVLVYGLGDSGRSVIKVLNAHDAHVSFFDDNIKYYEYVGFERNPENQKYDLVVISPGIKCIGNQLLDKFKEKNIPVISELDFAFLLSKGKIIAITGTNGKTTVSMLTNKILSCAGYKTFLCGNIGLPFSAICKKTTSDCIVVCEVSNFQLETSQYFSPDFACILNLKPDHLDRHETFQEYKRVKTKIAQNMKRKSLLVLNLDDDEAKRLLVCKKQEYFSKSKLKKGTYVWNNQIFVNKKSVISLNDIKLKGEKNLENVLACVSICSHFKVTGEAVSSAVYNFTPASHRMECLGKVNGATYIDDSKATNVASTIACVESFKNENIILLMGGLGKEIDYSELFSLKFKLKEIICFGSDRAKIESCAKSFGYQVQGFIKFVDAVSYCRENAKQGDYVLLSPACASFDEFSSYAERGEKFKSIVLGQADER